MASKKPYLPPEMQDLVNNVNAINSITPALNILSKLGVGGNGLKTFINGVQDLQKQAEELSSIPAKFNETFQHLGWIASESTSLETMKTALELAQSGDMEQAESVLTADYTGERVKSIAMQFWGVKAFRRRMDLIEEAAKLCQEERYLAAIPLLLIVVDGAGQDYFGKAIFSQGVDLTELNAIAGSETGLAALTSEMGRTRQAFNDSQLFLPYRNGILHGRDVNFGNALVAAKLWAYLQCVADVIRAKENEKTKKPKEELSLSQSLKQLQETRAQREEIDKWVKRPAFDTTWTLSNKDNEEMCVGTPEETLAKFLSAWNKSNYGEMGKLTVYFDNRPVKKRAGQIREYIAKLNLTEARIINVRDEAPAITNIDTVLEIRIDGNIETKEFSFRLVYGDETSSPIMRGFANGSWKVIASYQGITFDK